MKKHLLTAALAIVAVGGVFASNADTKTTKFADYSYTPSGGSCINTTVLPPNCGAGNFTCRIVSAPGSPILYNGTCASQGDEVKSTQE